MASSVPTSEVLNTYTSAQNQLWNQWLESVRQFEKMTPLTMEWESSHSLQNLNDQMQSIIDTRKAWARVWVEGLDHGNDIALAMMTWNYQFMEQQNEARRELLDSWMSVFRTSDPFRWMDQVPTRQSVEVLQDAINKTMIIPFALTAPLPSKDEKTAPSAKSGSEDVAMRKTA